MQNDAEQLVPFRIAGRYEARELLGHGGMASVYKAWDEAQGESVALKLLTVEQDRKSSARTIELFEREFHTLVQLAHPRIVRALDYGVEGEQPYYAMEILDGGDLRELSPLPWQDVCTIGYEICSALSLLHSRRLVHRDLTPRNIRRTQSGQAKLIDFGLLSPMGPTTLLAGTAPFVPPELVRTMSLDGRSDLFSLGATLYYALTRRAPYPARSFDQLRDAWRSSPPRPSSIVSGVPAALDELLLGLLRIDAGSRPKSAAEVMDRLMPLLSAPPDDELRVARAYLVTPKLVGRDEIVARFRKQTMQAVRGHGGGFAVVGEEGTGRSRMLDAFVLEAKLVGATAVRAGREDALRPFGVAASLAEQIHRAAPSVALAAAAAHPKEASVLYREANDVADLGVRTLVDITQPELDRGELQGALRTWILEFSARRPLAIAVDDLDQIDEPSAALLASLSWEAKSRRLLYLTVLPPLDAGSGSRAVEIVRKHAEEVRLEPLTADEVTAVLVSLFGNVPNLAGMSTRFAALSAGRPRECMTFAQCLVDAGLVTYAGGSWTLPVDIPDTLLPANVEAAFSLRVTQLGPVARHVATLLAENLVDRLSRLDLLSIGLAPAASVDTAIDELTAARLVVGDPAGYALTGGAVARLLRASDQDGRRAIHDELSFVHEHAKRHTLLVAYHALNGSRTEHALARLASETQNTTERAVLVDSAIQVMGEARAAQAFDLALRAAERLGKSPSELQSLRAMLAGAAARGADPSYFYRIAEPWLLRAKRDSGYDDWQRLDSTLDPSMRAMMAVSAAVQRYGETPEHDRGQPPQEGIQQLVAYVVCSIAIASRVLDLELGATLPELLVPFAPLNPMVGAILANARASGWHSLGKRELAQAAFMDVLEQLEKVSGEELRYVEIIRAAVCYAIAAVDTTLGIPSPWLSRYADLKDRNQRVSALFLRKVATLQQGDWELAEKYRQEGELLSLQENASSMFSTLGDELEVHALAHDLTGVKQLRTGIRAMAEKYPGWLPMQRVADAHYLRLCGDPEGALAAVAPALTASGNDVSQGTWVAAGCVLSVQLLSELGRAEEALTRGLAALASCKEHGMRLVSRQLSLSIAMAEAKLGHPEEARRRVEDVIAEQVALGVTGLQLGQSYEVAARIAVVEADGDAFRRFATLAGEQYCPGKSSVLGALYERLMDEGRRAGFVHDAAGATRPSQPAALTRSVADMSSMVAGCETSVERAERALGLLCDGDPPTRGHLFVFKGEGLELVASNTPCASVSEIVSFASSCIDRESRAATMETGALASVDLGTLSAEWRDPEGTDYEIVLLATTVSSTFCIGGIVLLAKTGESRAGKLGPLADAIAKVLIKAGDAASIAA